MKFTEILNNIKNGIICAFYLDFDSDDRETIINKIKKIDDVKYLKLSSDDKTNAIITYDFSQYEQYLNIDIKSQKIANEIKKIVEDKSTRFVLIPLKETDSRLYNMRP